MVGVVFEYRQALPYTLDITQTYFGVYGQDTWRLSSTVTMNYGVRWEPWFPQQHQNNAVYNFSRRAVPGGPEEQGVPAGAFRVYLRRRRGLPGQGRHAPHWLNVQPRVGVSWDPNGDGRMSVRAGYGLNSDFVTGQFFFDSAQAPPLGLSSV